MASPFDLEGHVALVTGSTRGIGWATARVLAEHKATVIVHGHSDAEAVKARAAELASAFGVATHAICSDVADPAAVKACYAEIFKTFKRLDVLVNNAGILEAAMLGMAPEAMLRKTLDVNTLGAILHLQEASRLMARNKRGSIVNMTSIIGTHGCEGQAVYSASKAALIGLTKSAAKELAPRGIRVNAVAPGMIRTDMTDAMSEKVREQTLEGIKMGRIGEAEEVALAVLFLASPASAYVTGQVLGVDGGMVV
ncbi:MAG: 3-oxoacyl-ACP reductase FabG [Bryobacteraceae bacterium]